MKFHQNVQQWVEGEFFSRYSCFFKYLNKIFFATFGFDLVEYFNENFKLFKHVLKTYIQLMVNPSWDATQWCIIRKLKK